jgi:hypothetical protein
VRVVGASAPMPNCRICEESPDGPVREMVCSRRSRQPFARVVHLNTQQKRRRPGAHASRSRAMEIAAVLMFFTAIVGFVQQFDDPAW